MQDRAEHELRDSSEKLLQDLKGVVRDGEALLKAGANELGEKGAEARERLQAALESARQTCVKLQEQAATGAKAADKVIRDHPYQSIGIAFGVGLLIGIFASRK